MYLSIKALNWCSLMHDSVKKRNQRKELIFWAIHLYFVRCFVACLFICMWWCWLTTICSLHLENARENKINRSKDKRRTKHFISFQFPFLRTISTRIKHTNIPATHECAFDLHLRLVICSFLLGKLCLTRTMLSIWFDLISFLIRFLRLAKKNLKNSFYVIFCCLVFFF